MSCAILLYFYTIDHKTCLVAATIVGVIVMLTALIVPRPEPHSMSIEDMPDLHETVLCRTFDKRLITLLVAEHLEGMAGGGICPSGDKRDMKKMSGVVWSAKPV